jgi:subtilase family serine protease
MRAIFFDEDQRRTDWGNILESVVTTRQWRTRRYKSGHCSGRDNLTFFDGPHINFIQIRVCFSKLWNAMCFMNEIMRIKFVHFNKPCCSLNPRLLLIVVALGVAAFFCTTQPVLAADRQFLHGQIPEAISHLQPLGRFPGTNRLDLAIGLPLRNKEALNQLIQQIYDPASANFRQYMTPEQFTEQFGPTELDYQAVIDFAKTNGLTVKATYPNRTLLDVSGSAATVEKVFHVTLRVYQHPTENRLFFAPDVEPSVSASLPALHISGLDNYALSHPNLHMAPTIGMGVSGTASGSAPGGNYWGNDFRNAYAPGVSLNGAGQIVGLFEMDGYYANDITAYETNAGLSTNVILQNILLDGLSGSPSSNTNFVTEVSLDIEMAISMAPGLSKVVVFEGNSWDDILTSMADHKEINQFSCSWGFSGAVDTTMENDFLQMIVQGQSFFLASGDGDAFTGALMGPDDDTNITTVGGTTLTMIDAAYATEMVWNWGYNSQESWWYSGNGYWGSGGGISTRTSIPIWQQGVSMSSNGGSTTMRNVPDVALTADQVWGIYFNGLNGPFGGTSCAAPLWAGFTALVNQQAAAKGKSPVGFINPAIYAIGKGPNYTSDFHDVTTGNDTWSGSPANFYATNGYDLCTGWGTPNGWNLINDLATPDSFGVSPGAGFSAFGPVGGPYNPTVQTFSLTNFGGTSLAWSLIGLPSWLNASSLGGTPAASGSTTVTVSLNATGSNLLAGVYATNLVFTNLTSGIPRPRPIALQTGVSLVQNGGFESGDLSSWTLNGTTTSGGFLYNGVVNAGYFTDGSATNFIHSGMYGMAMGEVGTLAYLSQTLSTCPGQSYLLSFWMNNIGGSTPNQFEVNWNTNTAATNTIFNQSNMGSINNWTNTMFILNATGTNTTLQFGARNDLYYFGLDDISVWPIPTPSFRSISKVTTSAVALTWNSLTNIAYRVEYSTNLIKTNWTPLVTNTATGFTLTITNAIGTNSYRFYRIRQLP